MDTPVEGPISEPTLLSMAKRGDLDAFEQIVMLYERRILALALRLTASPQDAQDATQETFLRMHRKLAQVEPGRPLGPWLYAVAVNACHDIGRDRRRSRIVPMEGWIASSAVDPSANPERRACGRESEDHLRAGLETLSGRERAALLLREMEGYTTAEVARILGTSEVTVRSQISNARLKLRKFFGGRR